MLIKYVLPGIAIALTGMVSVAIAETIEGAPPAEGTSCTGTCTQPGGQGGQWDEGPSTSSSSTDTYIETQSSTYNQAEEASDGKAGDMNQSNFNLTEVTTTVVTTTTVDGSWINNGEQAPPPKTFTETTVVYDDQSTTTTKSHVKPSKP